MQLAEALGVSREHTHAIELNSTRAARIAERYPDIRLIGPCDFNQSRITLSSFSCIYCNPPFDSEMGGRGREEVKFVRNCIDYLVPKGILVLVCPLNQIFGADHMCNLIDTWFNDPEIYVFPPAIRKFGEAVLIASRRKEARHRDEIYKGRLHQRNIHNYYVKERKTDWRGDIAGTFECLAELGTPQYDEWYSDWQLGAYPVPDTRQDGLIVWPLPFAWAPKTFEKGGLTQEEIEDLLERSPNYRLLEANTIPELKRPPLGLNRGHTSLALLTGILDGYVPSDPPHVVRGYCGKIKTLSRTESHTTENGTHVHKAIHGEVPRPVVRVVWPDGIIRTFSTEAVSVEVEGQLNEEDDE